MRIVSFVYALSSLLGRGERSGRFLSRFDIIECHSGLGATASTSFLPIHFFRVRVARSGSSSMFNVQHSLKDS